MPFRRKHINENSFSTGGASAAANAGVSDRLFKRNGRWKTDRAKDGYVNKVESILSVSIRLTFKLVPPYFLPKHGKGGLDSGQSPAKRKTSGTQGPDIS